MTVAELIAALAAMPADATVVTGGFDELGVEEVEPPRLVGLRRNEWPDSPGGPHEIDSGGEPAVWLDWRNP